MDTTRQEDIKDKAKSLIGSSNKVKIRTIPSTKYPKGAKYEGKIIDVLERVIIFDDTYTGKAVRFHIYFSEISSPADIWEESQ